MPQGFGGLDLCFSSGPTNLERFLNPARNKTERPHRAKGRLQSAATKHTPGLRGVTASGPPSPENTRRGPRSPGPNQPRPQGQATRTTLLFFLKWGATGAILKTGWSLNRPNKEKRKPPGTNRNRHNRNNRQHQDKWARLTPPPTARECNGEGGPETFT